MRFAVLGPLLISGDDDEEIPVRQLKQRQLLAALALYSAEHLSTESLAGLVWGQELSASPGTVRTQVWALRREPFLASRIARDQRGYRLCLRSGELDADDFSALTTVGLRHLAASEIAAAASALSRALGMWRDPPLADIPETLGMSPIRERLLAERAAAEDAQITTALMLRQHQQVLGVLRERVARQPEREQSWAQLMLAQYRCHRRADALDTYTRARRKLASYYGIEPGPRLRQMHELILRDDPALDTSSAAEPKLL
jgi:DNA-binding SARP family transcriptional activator